MRRTGIGHDNAFSIDIKKASDRKLVWALVMVLCPRWIHCGVPCTFWVAIAHWTRVRDLDKNEMDRMESLLCIICSRLLVYYQASRWRHSSIDNPKKQRGVGFGYCAGHDACQQDELCGYGSLRLGSERSMQRQVVLQVNAACLHVQRGVFDAQVPTRSRTRECSRRYKRGPIQGQESVRDFRAISFAVMRYMGIPCKHIHIAFLTLR